jgi:hypothetical protein
VVGDEFREETESEGYTPPLLQSITVEEEMGKMVARHQPQQKC